MDECELDEGKEGRVNVGLCEVDNDSDKQQGEDG